jgi:micrococcal nuclease
MANWTDINAYRRSRRWRGRGTMRRRAQSTLADVRVIGLGGFLAALVYFQAGMPVPWQQTAPGPASPFEDIAANDWQAPANLPRPTASRSDAPGGAVPLRIGGSGDTLRARFVMCHSSGGTNCVVDGDTFWFQGQKIRLADIDTPETHPPRCAEEARLGAAATARLQDLLNAGPFTLEAIDRDTDAYGRALRTVTRGGESLGGVLVDEGLARWYGGGRQPWC